MGTPLNVLLLEDREDEARVILRVLSEAGFDPSWKRVDTEAGFEAALSPEFDVILADYLLPQWSGLEALELVNARGIEVPVILMAGAIGEDLAVEAVRRGAADYVLKDRPERLGSSVRNQVEVRRRREEERAADAAREVDRERAIEALRESEERYRTVIEGADEIIFTLTPGGMLTSLNPAFERVSGWRADEWLGRHFIEIISVSEREAVSNLWERLLSGHPAAGIDLPIVTRDGRTRVLHGSAIPASHDGKVAWISGIARDVTDERRVQQEGEELTRRLELVLQSTDEGLFACDVSGNCLMVNRSAATLLGYEPHELIGRDMDALIQHTNAEGRPRTHTQSVVSIAMQSGRTTRWADQVFWTRSGTSFPVDMACSPILDQGVIAGAVVTFTDATKRHAIEKQLERANRVGSLGRLAATMAHEFNNVLMGIQPFAEILARRVPDDETLVQATQRISSNVKRGKRIAQEILRFTQPARPSPQPVEVASWLEAVGSEVESLMPPTITVVVPAVTPTLRIAVEPFQLQQAIINLALNARDAMPEGGTLELSADLASGDGIYSFGVVEQPSDYVRISVTDSGCGMTPEALDHLFEPLFTTKPSGTGIGLPVTHQIVKSHRGEIFVESGKGKGTSFHLFIPVAADRPGDPAVAIDRAPQAREERMRVLLIEDDETVSAGLTGVLEMENIDVKAVDKGALAADAVRDFVPNAVVLDVGLPDMSGTDVYLQISKEWPELPVIFSTGHADLPSLQHLLARGNVSCLLKPYETRLLLEQLELLVPAGR